MIPQQLALFDEPDGYDYEPTPEEIAARFICVDCHLSTDDLNEYYMVRDEVWNAVMPPHGGMLCVGCLETRIGRTLTAVDFSDVYVNKPSYGQKSARLLDRLEACD